MEECATSCQEGARPKRFADHKAWLFGFLVLIAWQAWMTLGLFGPESRWERLCDDRPIVSGSHPLHLYFGHLGASALRETGTLCCFDPAFQAGYPKTPVFDSGSRPAELFLTARCGISPAAAYKIGLMICCLLAPLLLWIGARGAGLSRGRAFVSGLLGLVVWWGRPGRALLEAGDLDLLMGALFLVAFAGLLLAYHRRPSSVIWAALLIIGTLGWFAHPFLFLLFGPIALVYYLSVGTRHSLPWHVGLVSMQAGAFACNAFWLIDWLRSWWLRLPLQIDEAVLTHRTWTSVWNAGLWGAPADRSVATIVLLLALVGIGVLNQTCRRPAARVFGLGALGFLVLAVLGIGWAPFGKLGTSRLMVPGLWFATIPAVIALGALTRWAGLITGAAWRGVAVMLGIVVALGFSSPTGSVSLAQRMAVSEPLLIGYSPEQQAVIEMLKARTTNSARVLWEDLPRSHEDSRWTALLPLTTRRSFLGGLGSDLCIEHAFACLVAGNLAGRPIAEWSDHDLGEFIRRYNIGWAVCRSAAAVSRLKSWSGANFIAPIPGEPAACLFGFQTHSFFLQGSGQWVQAVARHIVLRDVVPVDGIVLLSLHFQTGLKASPSRVVVEPGLDAYDPIPLVRLKIAGPVARLTLTWEPD